MQSYEHNKEPKRGIVSMLAQQILVPQEMRFMKFG